MIGAAAAAEQSGSWEWMACGASVTGEMHQRRGLGCDDAYSYGVAGDFLVAAVADGAGSVSGTSAWGSYAACQSVLENAMEPAFIRDFRAGSEQQVQSQMRWLFDRSLDRVRGQADAMALDASLLSTTLCVAFADRRRALFGQIGDGVIAAETEGRIETLLIESKNEYANSTWFIQSDRGFEESFRTATRDGLTALALSTDGMAYKITNIATGEAYEPFFQGSWKHVREGADAAQFAALLRGIEDDQTGDDKTMVLAALRWEPGDLPSSLRPVRPTMVSSGAPGTSQPEVDTDALPQGAPSGRRRWFGKRDRQ